MAFAAASLVRAPSGAISGVQAVIPAADCLLRAGSMEQTHELIMGVDQGTQSTRVYLFDHNLQPVGMHQMPVTQYYPHPG